MRLARRLTLALLAALLGSAVLAATALGHAKLLGSKPKAGQVLERSPRTMVLVFNEAIDPEFVRLQVADSAGRRVDRGGPYHPGGGGVRRHARPRLPGDGARRRRRRVPVRGLAAGPGACGGRRDGMAGRVGAVRTAAPTHRRGGGD